MYSLDNISLLPLSPPLFWLVSDKLLFVFPEKLFVFIPIFPLFVFPLFVFPEKTSPILLKVFIPSSLILPDFVNPVFFPKFKPKFAIATCVGLRLIPVEENKARVAAFAPKVLILSQIEGLVTVGAKVTIPSPKLDGLDVTGSP